MRKAETYFLRVIPSSDDLTPPIADYLRQHYPTLTPRRIIFVPSQEYTTHRRKRRYDQRITPERMLLFGDDRLVVIEQYADSPLSDTLIRYDQVVRVDWALILLYAYVSFTWAADDGLKTLRIEYNGVGDDLIRGELKRLRQAQHDPKTDADDQPSLSWEAIEQALPLKFSNYLYYALLPNESVRQIVFQPGIGRLRRYLRFHKQEDRMLALTSEGLIVLEEAHEWMNYGILIRYFSLQSIRGIRFEVASDRVHLRLTFGTVGLREHVSLSLSEPNARRLADELPRFAPAIAVEWTDPVNSLLNVP